MATNLFPIPFDTVNEHSKDFAFRGVTLSWPSIMEPEEYLGKVSYTTGIQFEGVDCDEFTALEELIISIRDGFIADVEANQYIKKPKKGGWKLKDPVLRSKEVDEDDDENVRVYISAKKKAVDGKGREVSLPVVDAAKQPINRGTYIGAGTVANVAVTLKPYYMAAHGFGVSIELKAVQVTKLRSGSAPVKVDNLFDVEDGFTEDVAADELDEAAASTGDF